MAAHFEKLHCGPRAILLMAESAGVTIDPDELWTRFERHFSVNPALSGAIAVSSLIDMARAFGLAETVDVTHDVRRAELALGDARVTGVLLSWERARLQKYESTSEEIGPHGHIAHLRRCIPGGDGAGFLEVMSPRWPGEPERLYLSMTDFDRMMAAFWIFYRP